MNKRILLAIPTNKYITPETMKSIYDLKVPEGFEVDFQYFYGYQIDQIRNLIAHWAVKYDYLLSVDSDIVVPEDALVKMIAADKDIITGLYIQRKPGENILEVYMDVPGGVDNIPGEYIMSQDLVEIAGCGMGLCLIKSQVFRSMSYPHFYYKSALSILDTVSEDIYFCQKARSLGFTIWADPSIVCDHIGQTTFSPKTQLDFIRDQDVLPKAL